MTVDRLWFLTTEANQRAEQSYHRLCDDYSEFLEPVHSQRVSRSYFRTLVRRVRQTGAPFGAHTIVHQKGDVLLVRHETADKWVVPGGEVRPDESYREAAERELGEEAGVDADYEGLAVAGRVDIQCGAHSLKGVLPVFAARAVTTDTVVDDPDGEISDARWFPFSELPPDTRDRETILAWHDQRR